jgi:hypothetical protein
MTAVTKPAFGSTYNRLAGYSPVLGPQALKTARAAYLLAWAEMSPRVSSNPLEVQREQLRLANAVLAVAGDHITDAEALKKLALRVLAAKIEPPI